jgi:hypothetical protein
MAGPERNNSSYHRPGGAKSRNSTEFCGKFFLRNVLYVFNFLFWVSTKYWRI